MYSKYQEFEFIRQKKVVPLTGSDGQVRYVETRKVQYYKDKYTYVMKQHAKKSSLATSTIRGKL